MNIIWKTGAAAALIVSAGLAAGASAHPHPEGDGAKKEVVIIERVGGNHAKHGKDGKVREFKMMRHGGKPGDGHVRAFALHGGDFAECKGGEKLVDESAGDEKEKTKVILCTKGEASPAERAKRLEQALSRIESNEHISAEHKAKITASLRAAIERARSAN
jgi:hypothetical protein